MDRRALDWIRRVTAVTDLQKRDSRGWREYTGDGFRRSPLAGQFTLALALRRRGPPAAAPGSPEVLLQQEGYLDLSDFGKRFELTLDGHTVSAPWPEGAGRCVTLAVSVQLAKNNQISRQPDRASLLQLFLDGELVQQTSFHNPALNPVSPEVPLRVRIEAGAGWHMPDAAAPVISTRFIRRGEIADRIHPALQRHCRV
jgi:hypothetical protein